jgi:signal transduction histidine kinase
MAVLRVIQGPDKGRLFELPDTLAQLLGRSSEALALSDNTVSRRHAELTPDGGVWFVRDLGSQNGTFVNGVRVEGRVPLRAGDQLRIGLTLMSFGTSAEPPLRTSPVRLAGPERVSTSIERAIASSEDSVILALELDAPVPGPGSGAGVGPGGTVGGTVFGGVAGGSLRALYKVTTLISALPERQALLEGVLDIAFSEIGPERGCVVLIEHGEQRAAVARVAGKGAEPRQRSGPDGPAPRMDVPRTILQHALEKSEGVLSTNAMADPRFRKGDSVQRLSVRSAMCAPIRSGQRTLGAIYLDSSAGAGQFTAERLQLLNAIGQQTGLALVHDELLEQRLSTERLATMGQTVAMLSHSIKNILQGLRGGADVVEMGLKKDDLKLARGGWPIVKRNLDRIIGLTMNMLAYSRPRALDLELTSVPALLDDCAQLMGDLCKLRGVALILDADPEMPPVPLDAALIHQAVMNLLSNAVEAVDARTGAVTASASFTPEPGQERKDSAGGAARGRVTISVSDNGPGITPEHQRRVFEPFFTTKGIRGTGLGLVVTRRIVEQHGGTIRVVSEPGKGALLEVVIPVDPASGIDPSATTETRGRGG